MEAGTDVRFKRPMRGKPAFGARLPNDGGGRLILLTPPVPQ